ncbi:ABC transporter ATP-binding protein [Cellvibrio sp. PSBB023]|uniref:ABC transporter ATP-binding protein n=1 Tax=Cellvibrio sp. PSBB023 TaxID=1945512 RepID=UPI00098F6B1B|nr:ABC transporter ATP-binding protein [Cellvibrio sp. PSBB023]AQT60682.1 ABC transporter ATP-binding protein [Cellvibrio sp. PSBB023]
MSSYISLNNLERQFPGVTILKGITAEVLPGQVIALLGKNGAGKTTLLETILGFGFPSDGEATLWNINATEISGDIKQRIGFVPQQDELLPSLTGKDHLKLFKSFRTHWNQPLVDKLIAEWLIPMDMHTGKMSVGQRQKLSILLALAHEPELLILDEPVASLDPIARRQFLQQLVDIAADENRAVIFSTHIVSDVERVANQVWMLRDGVLVYQGGLDELKESVVRVTLMSDHPFTQKITWPYLIKQKNSGNQAQLILEHWQLDMEQQLAQDFSAQVRVEYLSLEDIFLELNP